MIERSEFRVRYADGEALALGRRTVVMGILNVTPDSFSDGGRFDDAAQAVEAAHSMIAEGAEIIDVGGESTRPGASEVDAAEEARRVLPVIEQIKERTAARVSVDTRKAAVAEQAIDAGADMVNDVSGLADPEMPGVIRDRSVPVVIMHMRGTPETMQGATEYEDVTRTVGEFLARQAARAVDAGIDRDRIVLDPGIGFGKSAAGNLTLLERLPELTAIGYPVLIGASRKSFIGKLLDLPVEERLEPSLAAAAYAVQRGAHVVRAHDVAATVRTVRMMDAIRSNLASAATARDGGKRADA